MQAQGGERNYGPERDNAGPPQTLGDYQYQHAHQQHYTHSMEASRATNSDDGARQHPATHALPPPQQQQPGYDWMLDHRSSGDHHEAGSAATRGRCALTQHTHTPSRQLAHVRVSSSSGAASKYFRVLSTRSASACNQTQAASFQGLPVALISGGPVEVVESRDSGGWQDASESVGGKISRHQTSSTLHYTTLSMHYTASTHALPARLQHTLPRLTCLVQQHPLLQIRAGRMAGDAHQLR
jgi:hypothetical protein